MDNESILEYFTKNATVEQHRLVNTVYGCDFVTTLTNHGLYGKTSLTMDEVYLLFITINLEKDLNAMQERMLDLSVGDNKETFKEFVDSMELRYDHIVELNGGNVE